MLSHYLAFFKYYLTDLYYRINRFLYPKRRKRHGMRMNSEKQRKIKAKLFELQLGFCRYCSRPFPKEKLTFDHLVPVSRGGRRSAQENLVLCCFPCNNRKGARTFEEF